MIYRAEVGPPSEGVPGTQITVKVGADDGMPAVEVGGHAVRPDLARLSFYSFSLLLDGESHSVSVRPSEEGYLVLAQGRTHQVRLRSRRELLNESLRTVKPAALRSSQVRATIPGLIRAVKVSAGDRVSAGDGLVILEAMKMENEIGAPQAGVVKAVRVSAGQAVEKGAVLVELQPS